MILYSKKVKYNNFCTSGLFCYRHKKSLYFSFIPTLYYHVIQSHEISCTQLVQVKSISYSLYFIRYHFWYWYSMPLHRGTGSGMIQTLCHTCTDQMANQLQQQKWQSTVGNSHGNNSSHWYATASKLLLPPCDWSTSIATTTLIGQWSNSITCCNWWWQSLIGNRRRFQRLQQQHAATNSEAAAVEAA